MPPIRVLVCGDREWNDVAAVRRELSRLPPNTIIIQGGARGADACAAAVARELGLKCLAFPANWDKYGRSAGPIRNGQMLGEGQPDQVLAFHPDLPRSRGTAHMVKIARAKGVPVTVFDR